MPLAVVLAGGGTGGHIFPALALADTIRKHEPDASVRFVGTALGMESKYIPQAGYPLELVPGTQILGHNPLRAALGLLTVARGVWQARKLLREPRADLVIGVGGYASVPAVAAARWLGIDTALLEPNARPGRANRLLARFSKLIFVQFQEAFEYFPRERTRLLGFPVRELPRRSEEAQSRAPKGLQLLVVGGSQGARSVNRAMSAALPRLAELAELSIVHQTGPADLEEVRAAYRDSGVDAEVEAFFHDLPERLARTHLVVARAGAATIAELCVSGVPSILVPYPYAADDHQMANARELENAGGCVVIPDAELGEKLADQLLALLGDGERRARMAAAAAGRGRADSAEQIWAACAELIARRRA